MMRAFRNLIERQIQKAESAGQLSDLEGSGKPLPDRPVLEDPAISAGHRIMAQAGVVPREFQLKEELEKAKAQWRAASTLEDKKALMARIAELDLAYNVEREAYRRFLK